MRLPVPASLTPGIVLGAYMYKVESKHLAHAKHVYEENDHSLPDRPDYEYLVRVIRSWQAAVLTRHVPLYRTSRPRCVCAGRD